MPQLTFTTDKETQDTLDARAEKAGVSMSHYINKLIQNALVSEAIPTEKVMGLMHPQQRIVNKKLLSFCNESLALIRYLVSNLGDEILQQSSQEMLQKARNHAASYVEGLLGE